MLQKIYNKLHEGRKTNAFSYGAPPHRVIYKFYKQIITIYERIAQEFVDKFYYFNTSVWHYKIKIMRM